VLDEVRERPRYIIEAFLNERSPASMHFDSIQDERR
jgi:hypothetical protein